MTGSDFYLKSKPRKRKKGEKEAGGGAAVQVSSARKGNNAG